MHRTIPVILEELISLFKLGHTRFRITEPPKTEIDEQILNGIIRQSRKYSLIILLENFEFTPNDHMLLNEYRIDDPKFLQHTHRMLKIKSK